MPLVFTLPVNELEPTFKVLQATAACLSAERAEFLIYMPVPSLLVSCYIISNGFTTGISKRQIMDSPSINSNPSLA